MSKFIPNSFQLPNAFVDEMLARVSGNACKVYLLIVRKTRGWQKEKDYISYSQIQKITGISSATVSKAIDELSKLGLIKVKTGNEKSANQYSLNDNFCTLKNKVGTEKPTLKNEVATLENEVQPTLKTKDTENNLSKTTKDKTSISSGTPKKQKPKSASLEKPCDVSDQTWHDLLALRKAKKSPLTISAWNIAKKQIDEAQAKTNHTLEQILLAWIERGWQGFKAEWYFNHINAQNTQGNHNAINQPTYSPNHQQPVSHFDQLRAEAANKYGNSGHDIRTVQPVITDGY